MAWFAFKNILSTFKLSTFYSDIVQNLKGLNGNQCIRVAQFKPCQSKCKSEFMLVRKSNLLPPEAILLHMHPLCNLSGKPVQLLATVNLINQSRGSNLCRHGQDGLRFKLSISDFEYNMVVGARRGSLRFSWVDLLNFLSSSLFFKA